MTANPEASPADPDLEPRAADGRVPGRRGQATRQKLLDCTADMLRTTSYRDLKVVDIAREAGTSPATFYQYFPDVESAILVLADDMVASGTEQFAELVRANSWRGRAGYEGAEALAGALLSFWAQHQPVLRVIDLATDEGDRRFANIRIHLLNDLNNALAAAAKEHQRAGKGQQGREGGGDRGQKSVHCYSSEKRTRQPMQRRAVSVHGIQVSAGGCRRLAGYRRLSMVGGRSRSHRRENEAKTLGGEEWLKCAN